MRLRRGRAVGIRPAVEVANRHRLSTSTVTEIRREVVDGLLAAGVVRAAAVRRAAPWVYEPGAPSEYDNYDFDAPLTPPDEEWSYILDAVVQITQTNRCLPADRDTAIASAGPVFAWLDEAEDNIDRHLRFGSLNRAKRHWAESGHYHHDVAQWLTDAQAQPWLPALYEKWYGITPSRPGVGEVGSSADG